MRPRTLAARLFFLTAVWAVFATALVAWFLSLSYRESVQNNLLERLTANLYNIMGSITPDEKGELSGRPDLRDSRFQAFRSGYYWSVNNDSGAPGGLASNSLGNGRIVPQYSTAPDSDFQRNFHAVDEAENRLIGIEAQAFLGEGDVLYTFLITGNLSEVDAQVSQFVRRLLLVLALFALGFVLVTYFIVRIGLSPLRDATQRLTDIRDGHADRLDGNFPLEIQPLIDETNSLIASNKSIIERARTQVGNLAHSLKTPLAVLRNEAVKASPAIRKLIEEQVTLMQGQVQTYLDRARISARSGTITSRTDVKPAIERLARVMAKLNPQLEIETDFHGQEKVWFAGEQQDFEEMVGNLLENACKFARKRIEISARIDMPHLVITIEDDGKGMSDAEAEKALKRGTRLDESLPGSGLGLSIVKDIASEYGGTLSLGKAEMNGLSARLNLPAARTSELS